MPNPEKPLLNKYIQVRATAEEKERFMAACAKTLTTPSIVLRAVALAYTEAYEAKRLPVPFKLRIDPADRPA